MELENLSEILAIVGPRRWQKAFFMYQLIRTLWACLAQKEEVLFVYFDDQWLEDLKAQDGEAIPGAFHQLTGVFPRFMFSDEAHRLSVRERCPNLEFVPFAILPSAMRQYFLFFQ
jgi:predicted AAA+ superfamily ATPase